MSQQRSRRYKKELNGNFRSKKLSYQKQKKKNIDGWV
jgi:hypothetical protein